MKTSTVIKKLSMVGAGAALFGAATSFVTLPASAAVTVLDFENIAPYPNNNNVFVQGFYNGGTSSDGTTGTNYGVEFSSNALLICLNTPGISCSNTSRGGLGNPNSQKGALFFLSGSQTFMNLASGFDTGFSFFYTAINQAGSISVYDGLNGTGSLLASLSLPTTSSNCDPVYSAGFCPFVPVGVGFAGIAKSVSFAGVANQIVFDDITFGSVTPDPKPVPEPASVLGLLAIGFLGAGSVLKRKLK
ncbi:MAG: PEP-CTERM sorting domain-containing protein [Microcystis flos-aquae Mf_WU_F_19750830_S460]|uniref:PEP-CTERM sorting domain-containing protein n=1 Tax=Microcystis flos-aquae Mf_WU_F_19750830_S460 TaxID=2486237 RepID=A0A552M1L2_9CHRO|nr:PEP-CTERM sorting domain-containing protein [Microcystis aeruginosa]TRV26338.1 MAG: PEP-CTERM sorting domain-containing protein [Microcystis flos-aquae Mf_WU_F_19750830_S460]